MNTPTNEELAVRALLSLLWQALQPYHFMLGFFTGTLAVFLVLVIDKVLP